MEVWVSHSNPRLQTVVAIGCMGVGLTLVVVARDAATWAWTNATAGLLLGGLLFACGLAAFLTGGRQSIRIDPRRRVITIEESGSFGATSHSIAFDDIREIGIGYLGRTSNFVRFYHLLLTLQDGRERVLFAPGRFYPGSSDRSTVEGWRTRLRALIDGGAAQSSASSR